MSLLRLFRKDVPAAPGDFAHYIFVDFENVQDVDLELIEGRPVHVTLLIGSKQTKLPTELSMQIHNFSGQLQPVQLDASGRNALDLTLSSYLGRTLERAPGAQYAIVSRDKDFDPMIGHWRSLGVDLVRVPAFAAVPFLGGSSRRAPAARARSHDEDRASDRGSERSPDRSSGRGSGRGGSRGGGRPLPAERIARVLLDPSTRGRPSSRARLAGFVRNRLGADPTEADVDAALDHLVAAGILSIAANGRVTYARGD
jgi:hypothetical protein